MLRQMRSLNCFRFFANIHGTDGEIPAALPVRETEDFGEETHFTSGGRAHEKREQPRGRTA